jgi:ParB family chromosome partitioning protein
MQPGDDAAALEASLIENIARLDPDEVSQWETFARLIKEGRGVPEISRTFGITERMVNQRLALGNLLPKIREAYRNEEIDAETIRHLTLASKAQQKEWLTLFGDQEQQAPRGTQLKHWLFGGQSVSTKVALFPVEEYQGKIVSDLFGEDSYFADTEAFWRLQNDAVAARRAAYLEAGWQDVTVLVPGARFISWEHEKTPKKKGGKVFITISPRGEVEMHEGWLSAGSHQHLANLYRPAPPRRRACRIGGSSRRGTPADGGARHHRLETLDCRTGATADAEQRGCRQRCRQPRHGIIQRQAARCYGVA